MEVGAIPADWRQRRSAVRIDVPAECAFLDIESDKTIEFLRHELALGLSSLGMHTLTQETLHGNDRRVTRLVSEWAYRWGEEETEPHMLYGIRYTSTLDPAWECWAVFGDTPYEVKETLPITPELPDLQTVAKRYGLVIH